ncbi:hypothetical protein [Legionella oakridgensis]|uniref:Uncharacterized protein n=2 Tax=Legionella oakridgensis TaxID=29423 RepID=W0BFX2_9GAMM|nr:hypothetical protein [Legionella oakridgensis]AHE67324.1 hypothetical protein Loa_01777 [Legionella oakridgensis ATCC 33761 = DSM 21215]ETO93074.1 hypothetical protein LOR_75c21730 [Legionella oakridgensis RV-2-2007]KTD37890.1 hypothetical protein Loak_1566 [Legionella oakridgensis]STY20388.1 Uncharacterised protein [Legionella longbeachae]
MKKQAALLDKISGSFFLAGFIISKLKSIPILLLASILNLVSLAAYLIGYTAWFLATLFYPNHPRKREAWYGFAEFKDQYQAAAVIGTVATILCFLCPLYPSLILPAVWLFAVSNLIWTIGEYHKYKKPPTHDEHYSSLRQETYLRYVLLTTAVSAITALAATLGFLFPPASMAVLLASIIGNGLTVIALYYWKKSTFDEFKPDGVMPHSYATLAECLSMDEERPNPRMACSQDAEPAYHQGKLFTQKTSKIQLVPLSEPTADEAMRPCL